MRVADNNLSHYQNKQTTMSPSILKVGEMAISKVRMAKVEPNTFEHKNNLLDGLSAKHPGHARAR